MEINNEEFRLKPTGVFFQGFDVMDTVGYIGKITKRYQANLLAEIEGVISPDSDDYRTIRKLVLDSTNNFSRAVVKSIFGDIDT